MSQEKRRGVGIKFVGGGADGTVMVAPGPEPQEFYDYVKGERTERYRHAARPTGKCPYHIYIPFKNEGE